MQTLILPTDTSEFAKEAVARAVALLSTGDVVALPTETVYGLAADALNPEAVAKVFATKERPLFDPLIVHIRRADYLAEVAAVPEAIEKDINRLTQEFWPGPLTLILPKQPCVPDIVTAGLPTVAVRVSAHPIFSRIVRGLERPIAAPSANRFGRISPTSASAVMEELSGRIPLIIDGGACACGLESTIVRVEPAPEGKNKPLFHILRPGPITAEQLKEFGKVVKAKPSAPSLDDPAPEAPGMLASHYAPRTPLRLLERPEDFRPEPGKRYALLSYRGDAKDGFLDLHEWQETVILSPGAGKLPEAAVRFFYVLRQLDRLGVDEIIAEPVTEVGLGVAMMDRLRRASLRP
jgi:L-threonylcarbamoyladenylate synthase